jgi:hypothetical protein
MIRIFVLVAAFFISLVANATGETACPSALSCDYESGVCDKPLGWVLDAGGTDEDFLGQNPVGLSKIMGYKEGSPNDPYPYSIRCYYLYGNHSVISIYTYVKELIGANWVFSGFGKNKADCSDVTDPASCSGTNQLTNAVEHKKYLQQTYKIASLTEASSGNGYYKYMSVSIRGNHTSYSCLPSPESPSGWEWISEGDRAAALPLCACTPGCSARNPHRMCTSCS